MKTTLAIVLAALGLAGCVAVPVPAEPYHRGYVVAPPPPVVVVRPVPYYGYGDGWRRRWH